MPIFMVEPDLDVTLEIPVTSDCMAVLEEQFARIKAQGDRYGFAKRLAEEIASLLPEAVDWHLKPPTKAQIAFARSICARLKMDFPSGALASRGAMYLFLNEHSKRLER